MSIFIYYSITYFVNLWLLFILACSSGYNITQYKDYDNLNTQVAEQLTECCAE